MTRPLTAEQVLDRAMLEDDLLNAVVQMAHVQRWLVYHIRNSKRGVTQGDRGFPDLVMARPPRLVIAELKREDEQLTVYQRRWFDAFQPIADAKRIELYVWRPSDWRKGTVEEVLR